MIVEQTEYDSYLNKQKYAAGMGPFVQVSANLSSKKKFGLLEGDTAAPKAKLKVKAS